ncbi:MAG: DUF5317 family protein [Acidimicrobiales bacterium]|nr:DUF5317 family protein [Acidimicrobiales bacterium]
MLLTVIAVAVGLLLGRLSGGGFDRLGSTPIRFPLLMAIGLIVPALAERFDWPATNFIIVAALLAVVAFAGANMHMVGMGVVLVGITMNLAPILANGAMPVDPEALTSAGLASAEQLPTIELTAPRRLEQPGDKLTFLGDIIPLGITDQVLSFGDLVLLFGIADIAFNLTRRRRRHHRRPVGADEALAKMFGEIDTTIGITADFADQPRPSALTVPRTERAPTDAQATSAARPAHD